MRQQPNPHLTQRKTNLTTVRKRVDLASLWKVMMTDVLGRSELQDILLHLERKGKDKNTNQLALCMYYLQSQQTPWNKPVHS